MFLVDRLMIMMLLGQFHELYQQIIKMTLLTFLVGMIIHEGVPLFIIRPLLILDVVFLFASDERVVGVMLSAKTAVMMCLSVVIILQLFVQLTLNFELIILMILTIGVSMFILLLFYVFKFFPKLYLPYLFILHFNQQMSIYLTFTWLQWFKFILLYSNVIIKMTFNSIMLLETLGYYVYLSIIAIITDSDHVIISLYLVVFVITVSLFVLASEL